MKNKLLSGFLLLLTGCSLFPGEPYRYLPDHENAALLNSYSYKSHTASSVIFEAKIGALPWYSDVFDIAFFNDEFIFDDPGTFELTANSVETVTVTGNSSTLLLIDQSGSYMDLDPHNNRSKAMNNFLDELTSPNDFLVGGFSKSGKLSKEPVEYAAAEFVTKWDNQKFLFGLAARTGGSSILYDAIDDAIDKLKVSQKVNKNIVVFLHAADGGSTHTLSDLIAKANLNNIKIHVLIFGDLPIVSQVWGLSDKTKGMLALCRNDSDAITVFDNLSRLLNASASVNKLTVKFSPTGGNIVSGNEYEIRIKIKDKFSGYEFNPVYVKVKIP